MKTIHLSLAAMVCGVLLLAASAIWPKVIGKATWTEQQAEEYSSAAAEVHELAHSHGTAVPAAAHDTPDGPPPRTRADAQRRFEQSLAELRRAQWYGDGAARWMRWAGTTVCLLGVAAYLYVRSASE